MNAWIEDTDKPELASLGCCRPSSSGAVRTSPHPRAPSWQPVRAKCAALRNVSQHDGGRGAHLGAGAAGLLDRTNPSARAGLLGGPSLVFDLPLARGDLGRTGDGARQGGLGGAHLLKVSDLCSQDARRHRSGPVRAVVGVDLRKRELACWPF